MERWSCGVVYFALAGNSKAWFVVVAFFFFFLAFFVVSVAA